MTSNFGLTTRSIGRRAICNVVSLRHESDIWYRTRSMGEKVVRYAFKDTRRKICAVWTLVRSTGRKGQLPEKILLLLPGAVNNPDVIAKWCGFGVPWLAGKRRYNIKLWKTFTDCFNCLPVAAIVDEKIFCMHGGLSPELNDMDQIKRVLRPTDVPDTGEICCSRNVGERSMGITLLDSYIKFSSSYCCAVLSLTLTPTFAGRN